MMSDQMLRLVVGAVLLLHGIAHGGALGALWWIGSGRSADTGGWSAARSWASPTLASETATMVAVAFWTVSLVGFVLTALAFWGIVLPVDWWRPLGVVSALVSTAGIVLFFGTWPLLNTLAALTLNAAVLIAVAMDWPPESVFRS
jgi:hypothetical protein